MNMNTLTSKPATEKLTNLVFRLIWASSFYCSIFVLDFMIILVSYVAVAAYLFTQGYGTIAPLSFIDE